MTKYCYGFKFLSPSLATEYKGAETVYPVPGPGEKWGPTFQHPSPAQPDGKDCGPGGWHVLNTFDAQYASHPWYPWFVRYEASMILGTSKEKTRVSALQLRRIAPQVLWRWLQMGLGSLANLSHADLSHANLTRADLGWANLSDADLGWAKLSHAKLSDAKLNNANLSNADLSHANLTRADLRWAKLDGADLTGADLTGIRGDTTTRWPEGFTPPSAEQAEES